MLKKLIWLCCFITSASFAATYDLPPDESNIVGRIQYHVVQEGESMSDIAKKYDVGFLSLLAANKGVDPFLPEVGYVLTVPTRIILPNAERKGIVVNLAELRLYFFDPNKKQVHIFPVGIGRVGRDTPEMITKISNKQKNPTWTPPQSIRNEHFERNGEELPRVVPAGPNNPLGNYAMRLAYGIGDYLIHGTNKDFGVGMRVSAGCIRMDPADIEWLFQRSFVGEQVTIINQPIKYSLEPDSQVFIEAHEPLTRSDGIKKPLNITDNLTLWIKEFNLSPAMIHAVLQAQNGIPVRLSSQSKR